jgi:beta-galactosidase
VSFQLEGPGELIGESPFALVGGKGAVWIRAGAQAGVIRFTATHARLGGQTVEVRLLPALEERA